MKLLGASLVLTCNDVDEIIEDGGILIKDGKICAVGNFHTLREENKNCDSVFHKHHVITPALINSHIHFEFSKNISSFQYGGFDIWLDSVMNNRNEILNNNEKAMGQAILTQKKCGVGSVCAISSYDLDLSLLLESNLRVIYCHEVLGANEADFEDKVLNISKRLESTMSKKSATFTPALALHAPYSVSKKLAQYILDLSLKYNLMVSTHFLESKHELEWLDSKSGYFSEFHKKYLNLDNAYNFSKEEFLEMFKDIHAVFVHCLYADSNFTDEILKYGEIISCPKSNLLLNGRLGRNEIIATDGKSSNNSVNLLDEMRHAFFVELTQMASKDIESNIDIELLAKKILNATTKNPAKALKLNNGMIKEGKEADIAIFKLECEVKRAYSTFILHANKAISLLVNGNDVLT